MKKLIVISVMFLSVVARAEAPKLLPQAVNPFFIYTERGSRENRYIPSGYMGDFSDIKMNPGWEKNPKSGKYCIRVEYSAQRKQDAGWSGVYWQSPANNWGDKRGGFNLTGYKKLTFWVRGEKGGETLDKFGMGGIAGQQQEGDTDGSDITDNLELTKEWKQHTINLTGLDLSHIIGGFLWAANADSNPDGMVFYLDEIRYEK